MRATRKPHGGRLHRNDDGLRLRAGGGAGGGSATREADGRTRGDVARGVGRAQLRAVGTGRQLCGVDVEARDQVLGGQGVGAVYGSEQVAGACANCRPSTSRTTDAMPPPSSLTAPPIVRDPDIGCGDDREVAGRRADDGYLVVANRDLGPEQADPRQRVRSVDRRCSRAGSRT